jgi:hypothetical protein
MTTPSVIEVIAAARGHLMSDPDLANRLGDRLFSHVPQETPFPYGICRTDGAIEADDKSSYGQEVSLVVDIYSREQSELEIYELLELVHKSLHRVALNLTPPHYAIECRWENNVGPFLDEDGQTRHAVATFNVLTSTNNA